MADSEPYFNIGLPFYSVNAPPTDEQLDEYSQRKEDKESDEESIHDEAESDPENNIMTQLNKSFEALTPTKKDFKRISQRKSTPTLPSPIQPVITVTPEPAVSTPTAPTAPKKTKKAREIVVDSSEEDANSPKNSPIRRTIRMDRQRPAPDVAGLPFRQWRGFPVFVTENFRREKENEVVAAGKELTNKYANALQNALDNNNPLTRQQSTDFIHLMHNNLMEINNPKPDFEDGQRKMNLQPEKRQVVIDLYLSYSDSI